MPKRGKLTKTTRDRSMIAGIKKHAELFDEAPVGPNRLKAKALVAIFEEHIQVIDDIAKYDKLKSQSVALEARLEKAILDLWQLVAHAVRAHFGKESTELRDFGVKPYRKKVLPVVTRAVAVAKRKATRKARKTMGKQQRKKIRGW